MRSRSTDARGRHLEGIVYVALAIVSVILTPLFAGFLGLEL
jgi:hypothetical protein